ncbi:MAG: ABC transporter ATP-binding protein [Peptococcaceae bacterium MAG4]|jgi:ABC-type polysaccharide/polyol phosphate transport system ATPase subunit|nr:ABC transporter ATP-binding protein [Peptococcaceae bacterium MAG4]NLW39118.1 ABC transporter ATP-binding protein [Peptococcaceae bacterium]
MSNNNEIAILVNNIGKCYRIYEHPSQRLKQALLFGHRKYYKEFWALRHVSFEVRKGEIVGIIGKNGSGKSTLLQIIAGTLMPTEGEIKINGRIAALLELGSGFNPEFSGRENVFLNGSIMGISREEMENKYESIVAFADIGDFIDQPVKTYSSGMFARLAFAVSIHMDPEILIVDEVLSVGDHFFQAKCMSAINQLCARGCTILLVSHSQATIKALCSKAVLLHNGKLEMVGTSDNVIDRYYALNLEERNKQEQTIGLIDSKNDIQKYTLLYNYKSICMLPFERRITERFGNGKARYVECAVFLDGKETSCVELGKYCVIRVWLYHFENCEFPGEVGIVVRTLEGIDLFAINSFFNNMVYPAKQAGTMSVIDFTFPVKLGPGKYSVSLGYRMPVQGEYVDKVFNAAIFEVINTSSRVVPLIFDVQGDISIKHC